MILPSYRIAASWCVRDGYRRAGFLPCARHGTLDFYLAPQLQTALPYCTICGERRDR